MNSEINSQDYLRAMIKSGILLKCTTLAKLVNAFAIIFALSEVNINNSLHPPRSHESP